MEAIPPRLPPCTAAAVMSPFARPSSEHFRPKGCFQAPRKTNAMDLQEPAIPRESLDMEPRQQTHGRNVNDTLPPSLALAVVDTCSRSSSVDHVANQRRDATSTSETIAKTSKQQLPKQSTAFRQEGVYAPNCGVASTCRC